MNQGDGVFESGDGVFDIFFQPPNCTESDACYSNYREMLGISYYFKYFLSEHFDFFRPLAMLLALVRAPSSEVWVWSRL